jgi:hypothetical protein
MLCTPPAADARETRKSNGNLGYVQFETIQLEHSSKSNQASKQTQRKERGRGIGGEGTSSLGKTEDSDVVVVVMMVKKVLW